MVVLGIDTATTTASVGVRRHGIDCAEQSQETRSHAATLLDLIDRTLSDAEIRMAEVDAVAVSLGPGSFTGLRVGLSTAKGLAYAVGAKLAGVSTLEALAWAVSDYEGEVVTLLDARKEEVYAARFRMAAGCCERIAPDELLPLEAVLEVMPPRCLVVGDADAAYGERMRERLPATVEIRPYALCRPRGTVVARLAEAGLMVAENDLTLTAEPAYLRPAEAELKAISR